uniref:Sialidase domain-containing protein n=1 Tax=viral metagenome TaxID=1070528 RepID=A0A6H1Z5M4_9ZZZZ
MKVTGAQYLSIHTDVKNANMDALFHYLSFGQAEGRQVDIPEPPQLPPDWNWQVYLAAYKDLRDAGLTTQAQAEQHYLANGYKENRWPVPGQGWKPPTSQGLHLILDIPGSQRPLFTGMRFDKGLLIGDYGGHLDGGKIQYWDGNTLTLERHFTNPKAESVFHLIAANDGTPICSLELHGMMSRREGGSWPLTFSSSVMEDLAFGIFRSGGSLYCLICTGGKPDGVMVMSGDDGRSWQSVYNYSGVSPQGCANSDGSRILLTGAQDNRPVIRDVHSNIITSRDDLVGREYTQICGKDGRWNFTGNSWIDYWENGTPQTVFNSDRFYAMWSECDPVTDTRVVLFGAWKENTGHSQVAYSRDGGRPGTWDQFSVPCNCVLGSHFADGGVYLFGGDWGSGRVYFFKF